MGVMTSSSLLTILDLLNAAGIDVWLDGGWGVDALLGRQTRLHKDADIIVRVDDAPLLVAALGQHGFSLVEGRVDSNFVLRDPSGLEVDVHAVRFNEAGDGIYRMLCGDDWAYPAEGFRGVGTVAGCPVCCLTPAAQMLCHTGYQPGEKDFRDALLLCECFGVPIPDELRQRKHGEPA